MAKKWIIIVVAIAIISVSVLAARDLRAYPQNWVIIYRSYLPLIT